MVNLQLKLIRRWMSTCIQHQSRAALTPRLGAPSAALNRPVCDWHRSVTMDAWSGDQLKKMQLGGNDALNTFLGKYSVDKFTDIKEKYNSQAAEVSLGAIWYSAGTAGVHCWSVHGSSAA